MIREGLSLLRKARGSGDIHRQAPFRPVLAPCGVKLRDPMVRRSGKMADVTCPACLAAVGGGRAKAKATLASIEGRAL